MSEIAQRHRKNREGPTAASGRKAALRGCLVALGIPVGLVILVIGIYWLNFYDIHVRYRLPDRRMPWFSVVSHQETNLGVSREQAAENRRAIVAELNELGMEAIRAREARSTSDLEVP
jgi:hypothetical protein